MQDIQRHHRGQTGRQSIHEFVVLRRLGLVLLPPRARSRLPELCRENRVHQGVTQDH